MKSLLLPFLLFFASFLYGQHTLDITITGLDGEGKLFLAIYNSEVNFLEEAGMYRQIIQEVSADQIQVRMEDLPTGKYALSFMVDKNGNDEMDYNFLGIPKEKYGFYTDPGMIFSLPNFSEVSFALEKDEQVRMKAK